MRLERKTGYFIAFLFLTVFGIVLAGFGIVLFQQTASAEKWPTTDGIIFHSTVDSYREHDSTMHKPLVQYKYTVNGVNYSSNRVRFGVISTSDGGYANEVVNRYPVGKTVKVYYNPDNPSEALLEPGITWIEYLPILFGLIFILIGIVFLFFVIKQGRGVKQLEIVLDKSVYSPGEKIQGKVFLKLKKPVQGRSLKATFVGEKVVSKYEGRGRRSEQRCPFIKEESLLDGDAEYYEKSYVFELKIPEDVLNKAEHWGEGVGYIMGKPVQLGERTAAMQMAAKRFLENVGVVGFGQNNWYVEVVLDIPHGINLQNEVEIKIQ